MVEFVYAVDIVVLVVIVAQSTKKRCAPLCDQRRTGHQLGAAFAVWDHLLWVDRRFKGSFFVVVGRRRNEKLVHRHGL